MAEQTIDQMLDGGASCLQYFKEMLDLAKAISSKQWPDWEDHVCRNYDNERGTDLASLRGDAVMLREQASAAGQGVTDQAAARTGVQTAWPDNAGTAAVATLNAHQARSEPVSTILDRTATAAAAVPDAVVAAVATKVADLSEFDKEAFGLGDVGYWDGAKIVGGLVLSVAIPPAVLLSGKASAETVQRFEAQLAKDLRRFDEVIATAVSAVQAAYDTVPAAAKGIDTSAFPAPSFQKITASSPDTPGGGNGGGNGGGTGGGGNGGGTGGGTRGGGSPTSSSPSTASPTSTSPTTASPTTTSPTTTSPSATPTSTSPAATTPTAGTPSGATPSAGSGTGKDGSSWLSQLLPKIAEQLGLSEKDKTEGKDADAKDAEDGAGKDGKDADKDGRGEKVLGTDALGRTVTATLSPDGKTVEVTAKKPDGTVEKVTLKVGEDGKLTPVDATGADGAGQGETEPGEAKPGETKPGETKPGEAKPGESKPGETKPDGATAPAGATPSAGESPGAGAPAGAPAGGSPSGGAGASPGAAPAGVTPVAPPPQGSSDSGGKSQVPPQGSPEGSAPAEEPCPPDQSAESGSGADFATSAP